MFLKIFLWFWLAMAMVVAAEIAVGWATRNEPFVQMWRSPAEQIITVYAESAGEIYEIGGQSALCQHLNIISNSLQRPSIIFDDRSAELCRAGDWNNANGATTTLQKAREIVARLNTRNGADFDFMPEGGFAGRKTVLQNGQKIFLVAQLPPPPISFFVNWKTRLLRILLLILTAGLLCYALARYLTSPLAKLRQATRQFADGDLTKNLSVRVFPTIGKRRDEISGLARDFDEMAARIENLVAAQKDLTTDISHELRSPLARLNVALEIARTKSNRETQPSLDRIEREANLLNEMISQMLLLSKLESGTQDIEKTLINLQEIVEEVVTDADFEANSRDKRVEILESQPCLVRGEARLLRSAIENVIRNAVRYTPEKTAVQVALKKEGAMALIVIRDFGAGVSPEDLDKLFRPFFRVGFARERSAGGFGLGLAITQRAVAALGGTVRAQNALPTGLLVTIELPIS